MKKPPSHSDRPARRGERDGPMPTNGMASFSMELSKPKDAPMFKALAVTRPMLRAFAREEGPARPKLDPETAAKHHLDQALESDAVAKLNRPATAQAQSEFKSLGTQAMALTDSTIVKFRQYLNKIPVYGSLVVVELDQDNECLAINSSLGTPRGVDHIAKLAPAAALAVAAKHAGVGVRTLRQTPRLNYYFDQNDRRWRLVYLIENVRTAPQLRTKDPAPLKSYIVDANTGKLVAALPRIALGTSVADTALDGLKKPRTIQVQSTRGAKRRLHDAALNLTTYEFGFKDLARHYNLLPGAACVLPPTPWDAAAIDAHANGAIVLSFLDQVLDRKNIDDKGGEVVNTVHCRDSSDRKKTEPVHQWCNAYWDGTQMVYGQVMFPGGFRSIAAMLDIVAHEMFHGVTQHSCDLEYQTQAGALNESYSDIFGVIVANYARPRNQWRWRIGHGFLGPGTYLRSMADPTLFKQPRTMAGYIRRRPPYTSNNDYGEVHDNSGIHNWAAYKIMRAKSGGAFVFSNEELAQVFYLALTQYLSMTSTFADSRRAVLAAVHARFRTNPTLAVRQKAVARAFTAVGIV